MPQTLVSLAAVTTTATGDMIEAPSPNDTRPVGPHQALHGPDSGDRTLQNTTIMTGRALLATTGNWIK
jgi:hypothetical protein